MDKWQGLHSFWSNFGLPAYDEASVPDNATMPYITYSAAVDDWDSVVPLTADLWYSSTSWEGISKKADEINGLLKDGGARIKTNGGYLWVTRGSPFAQRINEGTDTIKHVYIVLMGQFLEI